MNNSQGMVQGAKKIICWIPSEIGKQPETTSAQKELISTVSNLQKRVRVWIAIREDRNARPVGRKLSSTIKAAGVRRSST